MAISTRKPAPRDADDDSAQTAGGGRNSMSPEARTLDALAADAIIDEGLGCEATTLGSGGCGTTTLGSSSAETTVARGQSRSPARENRGRIADDSRAVISHDTTLPQALQQVVNDARRLLCVDVAVVYLAERTEDSVYWAYDCGLNPQAHELSQNEPVTLEDGISGLAVRQGRVLITDDYVHDDRFYTPEARRLNAQHLGTTSVVAVPMFGAAGPLGCLCVFDKRHRTFTEFELSLLRALAGYLATAIENARLTRVMAAAEARYRYLVEASPDVVWSIDAQGRFLFVNASCERLVGWRADELMGRDFETLHHPSSDEEIHRQLELQRQRPEEQVLFRCNLRHRDGRAVPVEVHSCATVIDGRWAGSHGSVRDTSERDRMEHELHAQAAELAASHERAHLAQELHDSVTQALFGMTLISRAAEKSLATDPAGAGEKLSQLRDLASEALREMRALIFEMRPGSLAEEGLAMALRKHVESVESRTGLPIVLEMDELAGIQPELEEALYRICQEALHNVVKHAGARHVTIELRQDGECVCLRVIDDGTGFDPGAARAGRGKHLGLEGMRGRAERFGGRLDIDSKPGEGCRLQVRLPMRPGEQTP